MRNPNLFNVLKVKAASNENGKVEYNLEKAGTASYEQQYITYNGLFCIAAVVFLELQTLKFQKHE